MTSDDDSGVSRTPIGELLTDNMLDRLPDDLQEAQIHGLDTAAPDESVLLHGPPGAGKSTESIIGRLAAYCADRDVHPHDITVCTYRRSLADELLDTVKTLGLVAVDPDTLDSPWEWIGTAHALACRHSGVIDRFHADDYESESQYSGMLDEDSERAFCSEHGIEHSTGVPGRNSQWETFHSLYRVVKCMLLDVGEYEHLDDDELNGSIEEYDLTWQLLQEFHATWGDGADFHAVTRAWEDWKDEHDVLDYWQQLEAGIAYGLPGTEFVVIDEIHDAYPLMSRLFERYIDAADTVVVAGDPHQVCNSFAGSHPAIFRELPDRVERELPIVTLPESHRVPTEHYRLAREILARAHEPPALTTTSGGAVYRHVAGARIEERTDGSWLPLHPADPASPVRLREEYDGSMLMLARTQRLVDSVAACLDVAGRLYRAQPTIGAWPARLELMDLLRLIEGVRPESDADVTLTDYDDTDTETVSPADANRKLHMKQARQLIEHTDARHLTGSRSDAKDRLSEMIGVIQKTEFLTLEQFDDLVEPNWWHVYGRGRDSIDVLTRIHPGHGFTRSRSRDIMAMIRAWERHDGNWPELDDVETRLLTAHASKGSEAEHCVIYTGLTRRVQRAVEDDEEAASNEARLWYVALTRAKYGLHVVRDWHSETVDDEDPYLPLTLEPMAAQPTDTDADADARGGEEA